MGVDVSGENLPILWTCHIAVLVMLGACSSGGHTSKKGISYIWLNACIMLHFLFSACIILNLFEHQSCH